MTLRSLYWKTVLVCVSAFTVGLFVAIGCGDPNGNEECVAVCTSAEPEHPTECADACAAFDGDATVATANVKQNCDTGEPPPPPPPPQTQWTCRASCYVGDTFDILYASEDCGIVGQPVVNYHVIPLAGQSVTAFDRTTAYTSAYYACPYGQATGYNATKCYRTDPSGNPGNYVTVSCYARSP